MKNVILLFPIALFALIVLAGSECEAVIYQYLNEKRDPAFVDDLQKVPEQYRTSARVVSGEVTTERTADERARDAARMAVVRLERSALQARAETSKKNRFLLSGTIAAGVIIVLVIMANLHVLKQHDKITSRVRTALIALFVVYLGIVHGRDVLGLFGKAAGTIQNVQNEQAEKGKRAAEFYRTVDQMLEQKVQEQSRQVQENQAEERR